MTHAELRTLHLRTWRDLLAAVRPDARSTIEVSAWSPIAADRLVDAPERTRAKG